MKPVIVYVDDEPNNLTVFEAALPEDWEIVTFDSPTKALAEIDTINPWLVISDQRMPGMKGIEFLEIVKKLVPHAVRMIVTGFSDEELVVESVRKAQVSDYIRKPWDVDDLECSLKKGIERYQEVIERERLYLELEAKTKELEEKATTLIHTKTQLEMAALREKEARQELECWVPPFVLWALKQDGLEFPQKRDLVGVTFDIVGSSDIHEIQFAGRPVRARVIELFSECILRNGGWRESHAGDSAYAHFGLQEMKTDPFEAALSAAREFRVSLRGLSQQLEVPIECGIALHFAQDVTVDVHKVQLQTPNGFFTQKSFDTTSSDVDLLHRIEKLVHELPGSNIIMSQQFADRLRDKPKGLINLGEVTLRGQKHRVGLALIKSDFVTQADLDKLIDRLMPIVKQKAA